MCHIFQTTSRRVALSCFTTVLSLSFAISVRADPLSSECDLDRFLRGAVSTDQHISTHLLQQRVEETLKLQEGQNPTILEQTAWIDGKPAVWIVGRERIFVVTSSSDRPLTLPNSPWRNPDLLRRIDEGAHFKDLLIVTHQSNELQDRTAEVISTDPQFKTSPRVILAGGIFQIKSRTLADQGTIFDHSTAGEIESRFYSADRVHLMGGYCTLCLGRSLTYTVRDFLKFPGPSRTVVLHTDLIYTSALDLDARLVLLRTRIQSSKNPQATILKILEEMTEPVVEMPHRPFEMKNVRSLGAFKDGPYRGYAFELNHNGKIVLFEFVMEREVQPGPDPSSPPSR